MKILAIETSCDETACAVVEKNKILSSVVASSQEIHKKYGGIVPEQAAREQIKCIIPVIQEALNKAKCGKSDIDTIAVTVGPGLIGSLLVGVETAKTLSYVLKKPIIPINHLIAHIYANFINSQLDALLIRKSIFPAICLIASGGHTSLVLMKKHGQFKIIGQTKDDAAGECFDKCSRLLGLGYPGGPAIEEQTSKFKVSKFDNLSSRQLGLKIKLPRPILNDKTFNFSFSGLKTAVFYLLKKANKPEKNKVFINQLASEIQEAVSDILVKKTINAALKYKAKSIMIGGGVAANLRLREKFKSATDNLKINLFIPKIEWCTDNAASIAVTAFYNFKPVHWSKIKTNPSLTI